MAKAANVVLLLLLLAILLLTTTEAWTPDNTSWAMTSSAGDLDGMELELDSESSRRILATNRRYISYGALSKNNVPCSRRGASYYNCRSGGQANPYSRACSRISRCRR